MKFFGRHAKPVVFILANNRNLARADPPPPTVIHEGFTDKIGKIVKESISDIKASIVPGPLTVASKNQGEMSPNQDLASQYQVGNGTGQSGSAGNYDGRKFFRDATPVQQTSSPLRQNGQTNLGLPSDES